MDLASEVQRIVLQIYDAVRTDVVVVTADVSSLLSRFILVLLDDLVANWYFADAWLQAHFDATGQFRPFSWFFNVFVLVLATHMKLLLVRFKLVVSWVRIWARDIVVFAGRPWKPWFVGILLLEAVGMASVVVRHIVILREELAPICYLFALLG